MTLTGHVHEFESLREHALGWRGLLDGLRHALVTTAERDEVEIHVDQVKEKWGSLRCYVDVATSQAGDLIDRDNERARWVHQLVEAAEITSHLLCYLCGAGATHRGEGHWTRYFCADHDNVDLTTALAERASSHIEPREST